MHAQRRLDCRTGHACASGVDTHGTRLRWTRDTRAHRCITVLTERAVRCSHARWEMSLSKARVLGILHCRRSRSHSGAGGSCSRPRPSALCRGDTRQAEAGATGRGLPSGIVFIRKPPNLHTSSMAPDQRPPVRVTSDPGVTQPGGHRHVFWAPHARRWQGSAAEWFRNLTTCSHRTAVAALTELQWPRTGRRLALRSRRLPPVGGIDRVSRSVVQPA